MDREMVVAEEVRKLRANRILRDAEMIAGCACEMEDAILGANILDALDKQIMISKKLIDLELEREKGI